MPSVKDVQSASGGSSALALPAFAVNPAAGDAIVVFQALFGFVAGAVPTDTQLNAYTLIGSVSGGSSTKLAVYIAKNVAAGATTVTCHGTYSNTAAAVWLTTGTATDPYNNNVFINFTTSLSASAGPSTLTPTANSLFLCGVTVAAVVNVGDPTGYNTEGVNGFTAAMHTRSKKLDWSANEDILTAYKISSTTENPTFPTSTGNQQWASAILSLSPPRIPAPTSIAPTEVQTIGGETVTITGTNFSGVTGVTLGGTAATSVVIVDSTHVTCTTPAHAAGAVDVVVQSAEGNGTLVAGLTYSVRPFPTGITPQFVLKPGGTSVTITGTGFVTGASVSFGGLPGTNVVVVNATTITCDAPNGVVGPITITVTNP